MTSEAIRSTLRVTKALADQQRLRILMLLQPGERCVCQLVEVLALAPSTVSKHLSILSAADLVVCRKSGRWAHYRLPLREASPSVRLALDWLSETLKNDATLQQDKTSLEAVVARTPETLCRQQRSRLAKHAGRKETQVMKKKQKVLFLCTGNSCRSQMAEGWARALKGDVIEAYSAGIETHGLNPNAVKVMAEAGVDISGHQSKSVDDLKDVDFDGVVTVCGHANETCPMWLGGRGRVVHVGFDDPPARARTLAAEGATAEEQLDCYRRVRDAIKAFVETLPEGLENA